MESAAIGGESRIEARPRFLCRRQNLVHLQNVGEFSHNSTERDACAQSRRDREKGNLGNRNERAGTFFSQRPGLAGSLHAWAAWTCPCPWSGLAGQVPHVTYKSHPSTQTMQ